MSQQAVVLIVEDNIDVAEMTCEIVELAGVKAVYRTNVIDAIDYLSRNPGRTVGVLTDVDLATAMSGVELALYVAEEWPEIAICVVSGYALERPGRLPEKARFLGKPWRSTDITAFVEVAIRR